MLPKSINSLIKGVLILAPPLLIGLLIFKNGVDFPVLDEWDGTAPLFEKMADGTLGIADFFAQHNEHRIFFPRLIFYALGRLTHWNIRAELWVIWLLALVCVLSIRQMAQRSVGSPHRLLRTPHPDLLPGGEGTALPPKLGEKQLLSRSRLLSEKDAIPPVRLKTRRGELGPFWISFAASVLLFSPLGVANFLWGFQVGFLLPIACITTCIWTAASARYPFNFLLAIILCTISTFSIASGFTSWLLTTPVLLLANARSPSSRKWWAIWVSLFSLELLIYFWDYEPPPNHPPMWWFLWHPITALEYLLLFFGGPFSYCTSLPPNPVGLGTGALLLLMLLIAGAYIWRQRRSLLGDALPWLMLAMVTVTSAVLMMIGRAGFGPGQARASRYVPFAAMLPIALVALIPLVYTHWAGSASMRARFVAKGFFAASFAVLIFCTGSGFFAGLPFWPMNRQQRGYGRALVSFINVVPETDLLAKSVFPNPARVKAAANALNRIGYLRPPLFQSNQVRSQTQLRNYNLGKTEFGNGPLGNIANAATGDAAFGPFQFNEKEAGSIAGDGWAFLPDERRPADAVLITIDNAAARGKPEICAIAQVGNPHQIARVRAVWDSSALPSTWQCRIPRERLPQGQHYYLEAWAFNVETLQAHRLQGNGLFVW